MRWPPFTHVFFDCDSTLTKVEGIDILAAMTGKTESVESLTRAAMDGQVDLEEVYAKRLRAISPSRRQIREIRREYKRHVVEDATDLIAALQALDHKIYIVSGGLAEPVMEFGLFLGVPRENIKAVDIMYDQLAGIWWDGQNQNDSGSGDARYLDHEAGALTASTGKAEIISQLQGHQSGRSLLVGDGNSDLLAGARVDLFVGYGGVVKRDLVLANAPVFIHCESLAPLLALSSGPAGLAKLLGTQHRAIGLKALELIKRGAITFQDERLEIKFNRALSATFDTSY